MLTARDAVDGPHHGPRHRRRRLPRQAVRLRRAARAAARARPPRPGAARAGAARPATCASTPRRGRVHARRRRGRAVDEGVPAARGLHAPPGPRAVAAATCSRAPGTPATRTAPTSSTSTSRYLREKIDRPFGAQTFETVRGAGYRLRAGRAGGRSTRRQARGSATHTSARRPPGGPPRVRGRRCARAIASTERQPEPAARFGSARAGPAGEALERAPEPLVAERRGPRRRRAARPARRPRGRVQRDRAVAVRSALSDEVVERLRGAVAGRHGRRRSASPVGGDHVDRRPSATAARSRAGAPRRAARARRAARGAAADAPWSARASTSRSSARRVSRSRLLERGRPAPRAARPGRASPRSASWSSVRSDRQRRPQLVAGVGDHAPLARDRAPRPGRAAR